MAVLAVDGVDVGEDEFVEEAVDDVGVVLLNTTVF